MIKQKYLPYIFIWFLISSIFCIGLDLVMIGTVKDASTGVVKGIDRAIVEQTIYFSVWITLANAIWSTINLMNFKNENSFEIKTVSKPGFNNIAVFNIIVFFIFAGNAIISPSTVLGFDSWWGITKSVIEHYLNPILIVIFYFLAKTKEIKPKEFLLKHSWWIMLLPTIYLIFVIVRAVILEQTGMTGSEGRNFPYIGLSPYDLGVTGSIFLALAFILGQWGLVNLMNFLSNLVINKISDKKPKK